MKRNRNFLAKLIPCIVLAAAMLLCTALPAYAAGHSSGDKTNPAKATITKVFKMPADTPTPAAKFVFNFEKVGMDFDPTNDAKPLDGAEETLRNMPNLSAQVTFAADDNETPRPFVEERNGVKSVVKETGNFLAGIVSDQWANGEGVYRYIVSEDRTPDTGSGITFALPSVNPPVEGESYSAARYAVEIWVEDDNGVLFPKYVCVKIIAGSEDEYYKTENTPADGKVDPTPGEEKTKPGDPTTIEDSFSQFIFTNKYWRTDGGGTEKPSQSALEIIKKVKGNGSTPDLLTKYFDFTVTVTQPSVIPTTDPYPAHQTYKAYIIGKDGKIVTATSGDAKNGTISGTDDNGGYFLFTSGAPRDIKLLNDERLVFVDLHIGSAVAAKEIPTATYIPSYSRTFGPDIPATKKDVAFQGTSADASDTAAFGFPRDQRDEGPHYTVKGQGQNIATFTNTRTGATPTGINVDNLPFVVLIGMAIAGFIGFVFVTVRRKARG